ncbi:MULTISPECIES: SpaH/EbpB family LPXTG-anchored major pilin [Actinotignum]|uniref:SpaH/EbpB family LPXTG-anchored major pilin n=3 Tax=Actinotignum timonense TaxID=1870995 RepID=A0AAW9HMK8_9ACTO|nr:MULTISPECIES: SpaH/EbpB family LPXTG-anchored major pilin [Actinotignum]MBS5749251.1 SpaH/EbpB family LPXTG-anchored major pilin [Actinotignum schaalii]MDE1559205.1 SpaH/EbpB family LPXTG-anchored major pilin [Actinotignum schaalii]MDE1664203.1 SpaH/EbpB family LPXTG-anchored major pilin [Actinotignum schaalii]MDK6372762.1 SpaH/EbpB family LPXTG-anchored major pilin [Actinotignum timonense]MDK6419654.1 SpaH/EbpB family LPXTG-anchored major pilin [Actinotignum timonense]
MSIKTMARGLAGVVALGLAALGLGSTVPGAQADNLIDPNSTYTLTVHAQKGPASAEAATGQEITTPGEVIPGAKFKLEKSTINVTTKDGFEKARKGEFGEADTAFTQSTEQTVNDQGTITYSDLKPGYYRLTQTYAPVGYSPAKVSYIMVPLTDPQTGKYMDNIHVYPKSTDAGSVTKKDITPETGLVTKGSKMTFQIDTKIRKLAEGKKYDSFVVTDTPVAGLEVNGAKGAVKSVVIVESEAAAAGEATTTLEQADYTVSDGSTVDPAVEKKVITLTQTGLEKVTANQGKFLRVILEATVADNVTDKVSNSADVTNKADDESTSTTVSTPGGENTPSTVMGKIKINKYETGKTDPLEGGKFELYVCGENGKVLEQKLTIDGKSEFDAATAIGPIRALTGPNLCVKEVKAPEGYELNPDAASVKFDAAAITAAKDKTVEVTIYNHKTSDFASKLPLTGGAGIAAFVLVGSLLLAAAYRHSRKVA